MDSEDAERKQGHRVAADTAAGPANGEGRRPGARAVERDLESLSLEQAVKDFEIANARVMDLTQRLISAQHLSVQRQTEIEQLRVEIAKLRTELRQLRNTRAFRLAERYWTVLGAFRR
jgi:chromosome segregation ATPase